MCDAGTQLLMGIALECRIRDISRYTDGDGRRCGLAGCDELFTKPASLSDTSLGLASFRLDIYWLADGYSRRVSGFNSAPPQSPPTLYHLGKLVEEYADYEGFAGGAFGRGWKGVDGEVLVEVEDGGKGGGRVVLIHSSRDELLSFEQSRYWAGVLRGRGRVVREVYDAVGNNSGVFEGSELVEVVEEGLRGLEMEAAKGNWADSRG
ncbi:hypothetical protein HOY80DRAFT_1116752 [Tuber brumale]|nr:hypothetical protein HOY80DRAFT_1116752 [Tuber brumale]